MEALAFPSVGSCQRVRPFIIAALHTQQKGCIARHCSCNDAACIACNDATKWGDAPAVNKMAQDALKQFGPMATTYAFSLFGAHGIANLSADEQYRVYERAAAFLVKRL